MKNSGSRLARWRRGLVGLLGGLTVVGVSYLMASVLHREALGQLDAARSYIANSDWEAAVRCLDAALRKDKYVSPEIYLLRARAINSAIHTNGKQPLGHSRQDALADINWFLRNRPDSGEAHYERGCALAGLAKIELARDAFAQAISRLPDPTRALIEHAALSFHASDYASAEKQMTLVIERHPLVAEYYEQRAFYRTFLRDFQGAGLDKARATRLEEDPTGKALGETRAPQPDQDDQPIIMSQDSPAVQAALVRLAGDWNVVSKETNGTSNDMSNRNGIYRFHDNRYSVSLDGDRQPDALIRVDLDPAHPHRRIDFIREIDGRTATMLGIYEFRDDVLRVCISNEGWPRPTAFETDGLLGITLYTMRPAGKTAR